MTCLKDTSKIDNIIGQQVIIKETPIKVIKTCISMMWFSYNIISNNTPPSSTKEKFLLLRKDWLFMEATIGIYIDKVKNQGR